jgi:hypothetical protein
LEGQLQVPYKIKNASIKLIINFFNNKIFLVVTKSFIYFTYIKNLIDQFKKLETLKCLRPCAVTREQILSSRNITGGKVIVFNKSICNGKKMNGQDSTAGGKLLQRILSHGDSPLHTHRAGPST